MNVRCSGEFSFSDRTISPEEGECRVFVYLDMWFMERQTQRIKISGTGGEIYRYTVSGKLRPQAGGSIPPDANVVFVCEVQQKNEDGIYCWVSGGRTVKNVLKTMKQVSFSAAPVGRKLQRPSRRPDSRGATSSTPLLMGTLGGRVKGELVGLSVASRVVTGIAGKVLARCNSPPLEDFLSPLPVRELIYPVTGATEWLSVTTLADLERVRTAANKHMRRMKQMCGSLRRTESGTDGIMCYQFPGDVIFGEGMTCPLPTLAMLCREAPVSTEAFWSEQIRQAMIRGRDTNPRGIQSREEWSTAAPERQSAFVSLVVANAAQMMDYKADENDTNERGSGRRWLRDGVYGAEIFSFAATEGSGDCEDMAILMLLMKMSLERLVPSGADPVLEEVQQMSKTYITFVTLSSVHGMKVGDGHTTQTESMGAHMTLVWMLARTLKAHTAHVSYPVAECPETPEPKEGQLHVMISEGTGPFTTANNCTDACAARLQGVEELRAPLAESWRDKDGAPQKTSFFSAAVDMYGVYGGVMLAYSAMWRAPGNESGDKDGDADNFKTVDYTYGAYFEHMMNDMENSYLLPHPAMSAELGHGIAAGTRISMPPPLMGLTEVGKTPPSDRPLQLIKRAFSIDPTAPKLANYAPGDDIPGHERQGYWLTLQTVSQEDVLGALVRKARAVGAGTVADMQWEWWPQSDYLGGVWRVELLVKK